MARFRARRYNLAKWCHQEDWQILFEYPNLDAYEKGGEPHGVDIKCITEAEYDTHVAFGTFPVVPHTEVRRGEF